ncbi:MAG: Na(+)/H(+) antiporter subunit D [Gemmatimonadota bacterium]
MPEHLPPGVVLIAGALLVPLLRGRLQAAYLVLLPVLSLAHMLSLPDGFLGQARWFDYALTPVRVDRLSVVFGYVFHLAALVGTVYALYARDPVHHVAALVYGGAAIAGVFAGDLLSLFAFWELTAVSSVFLVWARRTPRAYRAGMRYLIFQVGSGVLLLSGILLHYHHTGSLAFTALGAPGAHPGTAIIFLAFGIKAGFPLLHVWLTDAYPEATPGGAVVLSAFTTKLAIYALARGFAGAGALVPIGVVMALFPLVYAISEDDLRRLLAYALIGQQGFMVVGIGIGTALALNGAVAHAFACVLYMALLFMATGNLIIGAGTAQASRLGSLHRALPYSALFCLVGSASISAVPLFSGFVTKSLTLQAVAEQGREWTWLALVLAGIGAFLAVGIKVPYCGFFSSRDTGILRREAPGSTRVAMALTAALCLALGIAPGWLYDRLPYPVHYQPYTDSHVLTQLQLLVFAGIVFALLVWRRHWLLAERTLSLDVDWLYRRLLPEAGRWLAQRARPSVGEGGRLVQAAVDALLAYVHEHHGPRGIFGRTWSTASSVGIVVGLLAGYLVFYLQSQ